MLAAEEEEHPFEVCSELFSYQRGGVSIRELVTLAREKQLALMTPW